MALPGDPDALGRSRGAGAPSEQVLPGPGGRGSRRSGRHPGSLRSVFDLGHRSADLRDELARWTERAPRPILGCAGARRRSSAQSVAQLTVATTIVSITSRLPLSRPVLRLRMGRRDVLWGLICSPPACQSCRVRPTCRPAPLAPVDWATVVCPSGRRGTPGERVGGNPSRVRIPRPPPSIE
jgi:hypothetical protein